MLLKASWRGCVIFLLRARIGLKKHGGWLPKWLARPGVKHRELVQYPLALVFLEAPQRQFVEGWSTVRYRYARKPFANEDTSERNRALGGMSDTCC
jgi:hypothetical protein